MNPGITGFGTVALVFVFVTKKTRIPIDTSICERPFRILEMIGEALEVLRASETVLIDFHFRVVIGVRFTKKNRIIHLQVQEGKLLPNGIINSSTVDWVPVSDYTILDKGIKNGKDYHTINWQSRHVDLDELKSPKDHVVTGVRFRMIGRHMNLQIRVSQIDFQNGKIVDPDLSHWIGNEHTNSVSDPNRRDEIALTLPDVPIRTPGNSPQISHHNSYIKFTYSDMYKDASQTTVPFIDAQKVVNDPAVPLEGVGLILKARKGYGGFIAPKITTFDYSPYV